MYVFLLVALFSQINESPTNPGRLIDTLDVIDSVIACQSDEVQQVITMFEALLSQGLCINLYDIRSLFCSKRLAQFVQATAIETFELERAERASHHIINQIPKDLSIKILMLGIRSDSCSLEELASVATVTENNFDSENMEIWYGLSSVNRPEYFWIGAICFSS